MGSNTSGALEMSHFLDVIILKIYLSENFLVVVSNKFTFRVHAGGLLKNYWKYFGKVFRFLYADWYCIFAAPSETKVLKLM